MKNSPKIVFFGTGEVSLFILEKLSESGFKPSLVVTVPDRPKGRNLVMSAPEVKTWAEKNSIPTLQPEKLASDFAQELQKQSWDLFIVVAYGKIIPKNILEIPKHGSINIHYSLLPKLRGSSPVENAILNDDKDTGVSIILMDEKMDHGPIIATANIETETWPPKRSDLMLSMNKTAGELLVKTIPEWVGGKITPKEQDHDKATTVSMIKKEDALINLEDNDYLNFRKIMAYEKWPRAYFIKNNKRVIITSAEWKNDRLEILKVIPEGKKEMSYSEYLRGLTA